MPWNPNSQPTIHTYILSVPYIGMMVRVFTNGPGDLGSIPGRVIPKTQMPPWLTLSIIKYGSRVKWRNKRKGVAPSPTPWCSCLGKRNLWVTLDYGRQFYLLISKWIVPFCIFKELFILFLHTCMFPAYWVTTGVSSSLIGCPIYKAFSHICSLTKSKSWKHTRM